MRIALVITFFLLGVGAMLLPAWLARECATGGRLVVWVAPGWCTAPVAGVEEVELPAPPAPEALSTRTRAAPRAGEADPAATGIADDEHRIEPATVLPARATASRAPDVLPFARRLGDEVPSSAEASLSDEATNPPPTALAPGRMGTRAPVPIRVTSVPVPRDPNEAQRLLDQHYPRELKESGIGGTVVLSLHIDRRGRARDPQVVSGSGHPGLDAAALHIARTLRFTAAQQEGRSVETRILQPLVFRP
jgi:periplasmic protein TonB